MNLSTPFKASTEDHLAAISEVRKDAGNKVVSIEGGTRKAAQTECFARVLQANLQNFLPSVRLTSVAGPINR